jgi:hypothetical protein
MNKSKRIRKKEGANNPCILINFPSSEAVRHSIARVISSVASIDMPDNKWPALLEFLHQSCASQNPAHRETGLYCLYTLFEVIADFFMNNTGSLFELFSKSIVDPESKPVRITTVLVLGKLSEFVDSEDKNTIVRGGCRPDDLED